MRPSKVVLIFCLLILSAAPLLFAQTSNAPLPSTPTIRVNAREVFVDINVTDSKGNYVHGLTLQNFTVLEDGQPMSPRSFREHRTDQTAAESAADRCSIPSAQYV